MHEAFGSINLLGNNVRFDSKPNKARTLFLIWDSRPNELSVNTSGTGRREPRERGWVFNQLEGSQLFITYDVYRTVIA